MKVLRGLLAMICFVLGVISLLAWAVSALVVRTVEDGTVVTGIAKKVVEQPAVTSFITEKTQALVTATLSDNGVDIASLGLQGTLDDAVAAAVASDEFQAGLASAVDDARADLAEQLTSPDYEGRPLELSLDVSATINQTIGSTPVIGGLIPDLTFDPIPVPIADADAFGRVRGAYSGIDRTATWAGLIALVLIVLGVVLWPRKRWLIPLALLFAGLGAGALWAAMRWLTVERIAGRLPGGAEGDLGGALVKVARQESLDRFSHRIFLIAAACLVGALVSFIIIKIASRPAKRRAAAARAGAAANGKWADPATTADVSPAAVSAGGVGATGANATTGASPTAPDASGAPATGPDAPGTPATGAPATSGPATGGHNPHGQHEEHKPGHAR